MKVLKERENRSEGSKYEMNGTTLNFHEFSHLAYNDYL
jgi:hypothetical protein